MSTPDRSAVDRLLAGLHLSSAAAWPADTCGPAADDDHRAGAESALRGLTPVRPSAALDRRVMALFAHPAAAVAEEAAVMDDLAGTATGRRRRPTTGRLAIPAALGRRLRPALLTAAAVAAVASGLCLRLPAGGHQRDVASPAARPGDPATDRQVVPAGIVALAPSGPADSSDADPTRPASDERRADLLPVVANDVTPADPPATADLPVQADGGLGSFEAAGPVARTAAERPDAASPVGVQQTFERVADDGVVLVDGKTVYQRFRRQAVRRIVVVDPQSGESVSVSIPTAEILVKRVETF